MSNKVLNVEGIKNELEGASLYFTRPVTPPPPAVEPDGTQEPIKSSETIPAPEIKARKTRARVVVRSNSDKIDKGARNTHRTTEPTNERPSVKPTKRTKIRHTFDIFADQLLSLRQIALDQEKLYGERVLLGDLAQQALDMLIAKEKNKQ